MQEEPPAPFASRLGVDSFAASPQYDQQPGPMSVSDAAPSDEALRSAYVHVAGQLSIAKRNFSELSTRSREIEQCNAQLRHDVLALEQRLAQNQEAARSAAQTQTAALRDARESAQAADAAGRAQAEQAAVLHSRLEQAALVDGHRQREVATQRADNEALAAYALLLEGRVGEWREEAQRLQPMEAQLDLSRAESAALRVRAEKLQAGAKEGEAARARLARRVEEVEDDWRAVLEDKALLREQLAAAAAQQARAEEAKRETAEELDAVRSLLAEASSRADREAARASKAEGQLAAVGATLEAREAEVARLGEREQALARSTAVELKQAREEAARALAEGKEREDAVRRAAALELKAAKEEARAARAEVEDVRRAAGLQAQQIRDEVRVVKDGLGGSLREAQEELQRVQAQKEEVQLVLQAEVETERTERAALQSELTCEREAKERVAEELAEATKVTALLEAQLDQGRDAQQQLRLDLSGAQRAVERSQRETKQLEKEQQRRDAEQVSKGRLAQALADLTMAVDTAVETEQGFSQAMGSWETARSTFRHLVHAAQEHMDEYAKEQAKARSRESVVRGNVGNLLDIFAMNKATAPPEQEKVRLCRTLSELQRLRATPDDEEEFWKPSQLSHMVDAQHSIDELVSRELEPVTEADPVSDAESD